MVFYEARKRLPCPVTPKNKPHLTDFPDETLLQIVENVATEAILKLRLTCSTLVPVCTSAIQSRLKTLYIHPSTTSLKHALDICAHPVFGREIEKVVVLGRVFWREIEGEYKNICSLEGEERRRKDQSGERAWQNKFKAWPAEFPKPRDGLEDGKRGPRRRRPYSQTRIAHCSMRWLVFRSWKGLHSPRLSASLDLIRLRRARSMLMPTSAPSNLCRARKQYCSRLHASWREQA